MFFKKKVQDNLFVIAGLGNPTSKYDKTRHNVGFDAADEIARCYNLTFNKKRHNAMCARGMIEGQKVLLIKPLTYMNASGECISEVLSYYGVDPNSNLLVLFDDISLDCGNIRIRRKGSAGGHNGIKDIIAMCGSDGFSRIKIGVGKKPDGWDLKDHVLGRFSSDDRSLVDDAIHRAAEAAALIVCGKIDEAMNRYNGGNK